MKREKLLHPFHCYRSIVTEIQHPLPAPFLHLSIPSVQFLRLRIYTALVMVVPPRIPCWLCRRFPLKGEGKGAAPIQMLPRLRANMIQEFSQDIPLFPI